MPIDYILNIQDAIKNGDIPWFAVDAAEPMQPTVPPKQA
mgnify:FL=1